jgi:CBS domain-containing membrane protein
VEFGTGLQPAWRLLRDHQSKALPVVNRFQQVIGIVTAQDFMRRREFDLIDGIAGKLRRLLQRSYGSDSDKEEVVGQIMTTVKTAGSHQPVAGLVPLFLETGLHHLPVIDANQRLVGMVSQSELIAALYRSHYKQ